MNCEGARDLLPLFLYGELGFEQEEALCVHLEQCPSCSQEYEKARRLVEALDRRRLEPAPETLTACRRELHWRLAAERTGLSRPRAFTRLWPWAWAWRLAGAAALIALGFFGGQWTAAPRVSGGPDDPLVASIRFIEREPDGQVRIGIEERREHVLRGRLNDASIQRWLLAAALEAADPGLRLDSVALLGARAGEESVRRALLDAVERDPNPAVRLKALEALKPYAAEPAVRRTLARVLRSDDNPGVRIQAIDLLVQQRRRDELVGLLQEIIHRDENNYVRLRCRQALEELNASVGTF